MAKRGTNMQAARDAQAVLKMNAAIINEEIVFLEKRTKGQATDADRDIDFAYQHMGLSVLMPTRCPSIPAWEWYRYARTDPIKFLDVVAKREDAKSKMAGSVTTKQFEDDKRTQFGLIAKIMESVSKDVEASVKEFLKTYPDELRSALLQSGWKLVAVESSDKVGTGVLDVSSDRVDVEPSVS